MFRRILVATDFAPSAEAAWTSAMELARAHGSEVVLVHVYVELPPYAEVGAADVQRIYEEQRGWIQAELDRRVAGARAAGLTARGLLKVGPPADTITETALDEACDLIVVGTQGRGALDRLIVGSVAERVVRHAACAVLVVKTIELAARRAAA
ncbi:MAG TPA: universal stress protein [Methylomirabilota bacterium]|jgi:nucleotide-binding universal stress UspA family protein|nr:universal stress protein [Methylomirabilota bacterium]